MQQDRRSPGRGAYVNECIDPAARREQHGPVPRRKWLGRLTVNGHDANIMPLDFQRHYSALAAANEPKTQPFTRACRDIQGEPPVQRVDWRRIAGIDTGSDRGAVGAQTPLLDQKHLIAVDSNGLVLEDDNGLSR